MILNAWRVLRLLSLREYLVTVFTVLLPVLPISVVFNWSPIWGSLIYGVWGLVALLLIASMLKEQKESADQSVEQKIDEVSGQLRDLENKYDENAAIIAGLEEQVAEVDRVMRAAFEGIEVDLPARRYSLRASVSSLSIMGSEATVEVRGGSRRARLRCWVNSKVRRIWTFVWGK